MTHHANLLTFQSDHFCFRPFLSLNLTQETKFSKKNFASYLSNLLNLSRWESFIYCFHNSSWFPSNDFVNIWINFRLEICIWKNQWVILKQILFYFFNYQKRLSLNAKTMGFSTEKINKRDWREQKEKYTDEVIKKWVRSVRKIGIIERCWKITP